MNHQPFESWILDPSSLPVQDQHLLENHLASCASCRQLKDGWQGAMVEIRSAGTVSPAPGFTRRYQASLAARRERDQRQQALRFFTILAISAVAVLAGLFTYLLIFTTPSDWVSTVLRSASELVGGLFAARNLIGVFNAFSPAGVTVALALLLASSFAAMLALWGFVLWRTSRQGVKNQ